MRRFALVLVVAVIAALVLVDRPLAPARFVSHPHPAADYAEALRRIAALEAADGPEISPECRPRLMTHGGRTTRAVLLLHGLTNCPEQFRMLGERFFARGANVLIPRLPEHGRAERMTTALARLDARTLCAFTDETLDIAHGLGASVEARAQRAPPAAHAIVMITVGGDIGVDNGANAWLVRVTTCEFPAHPHLSHDIIDPEQVGGNPALVYPVIERLVVP